MAISNTIQRRSRVVIKIGTSSLIHTDSATLNLKAIASLGEAVRRLKDEGNDVVIVSSGAVGVGCQKLGLDERPSELSERQALAAVGQGHLMRFYEDVFTACGLTVAQVLLTLDNITDRDHYQNAANTFESLFALGVVPIVNENDTVAVEQLRFGDNDTLAAKVATLVRGDWLFLLTDVDCLYTANPATDPDAKPIHVVQDVSQLQVSTEGAASSDVGTGGMSTKLTAAGLATAAGAKMIICQADPEIVPNVIIDGEQAGTLFLPPPSPIRSQPKRWLLAAPPKGRVEIQSSAIEALIAAQNTTHVAVAVENNASEVTENPVKACDVAGKLGECPVVGGVTAAYVSAVSGEFEAGDAVALVCSESGIELGRGMAEIAATQLQEVLLECENCGEGAKMVSSSSQSLIVCTPENACILPSAPASVASSGSVHALSDVGDGHSDACDDDLSVSLTNSPRAMSPAPLACIAE